MFVTYGTPTFMCKLRYEGKKRLKNDNYFVNKNIHLCSKDPQFSYGRILHLKNLNVIATGTLRFGLFNQITSALFSLRAVNYDTSPNTTGLNIC